MINQTPDTAHRLNKLLIILLLWFGFVSLSLVFWGVIRRDTLLAREDNPRTVEAALRIQRGRILDKDGVVLAETAVLPPTSVTPLGGRTERIYPIPHIGPAVGYYSFRYGTSGIEEGLDGLLSGRPPDAWQAAQAQWWHTPQVGHDVRLTIDAVWQTAVAPLLDDHQGALLIMAHQTGEIRVMASQPSYDPNQLDDTFEQMLEDEHAPLLNRVLQGQYQPGLALQPLLVGVALEREWVQLQQPFVSNQLHPELANLITIVSLPELEGVFASWDLRTLPMFPLNTELPPAEPLTELNRALVGQDTLLLTPLQMGMLWGAVARNGRLLTPQLVSAIQQPDGSWQNNPFVVNQSVPIEPFLFDSQTALQLRQQLPQQAGVHEYATLVLAGPNESQNAWYIGFDDTYLVVVVLEGVETLETIQFIGREALQLQ